jgi:enterochelin esterase-like enzyme
MLEPQSTVLFILLIAAFSVLMWWMVRTGQLALRVLAGFLGFTLAMMFGVMAVNKYYGYYTTWGAAFADLTNEGITVPQVTPGTVESGALVGGRDQKNDLRLVRSQGYTVGIKIVGQLSHISRQVYVYLPPQYFQPAYRKYKFPVIELLHGQPGEPQDWIDVVGVTVTLDQLMRERLAQPAVLVMPDVNGGRRVSLQCLNQAGGPQDLTYLARDLPDQIARIFRVQPPGPAWGVAGYSEGGFCAANMALQYRTRYGYAGVLSGYFRPLDNQLLHPFRRVSPFGGNRAVQRQNTPLAEVETLRPGAVIPRFWLGAGKDDRQDVANAQLFWQELQLRQANVPLVLTPGTGHTMATWRAEVPTMLKWMTQGLAREASRAARPAGLPARARSRPVATVTGQGSWK